MSESGIPGRVVTALVGAGLVDPQRADAATSVVEQTLATLSEGRQEPSRRRTGPRLTEVAAYAGAALVVAAVILLGVQYWADLEPLARSLVLAGTGVLLLGSAATLVRLAGGAWRAGARLALRPRYLASALWVAAAVSLALALGSWILATLFAPPNYDVHNVATTWGVVVALTVLVLGYLLVPSALLHLALAFGSVMLVTALWLGEGYLPSVWRSLIMVGVAALWVTLAETGVWHEPKVGGAVGAGLLLMGAQLMLGYREVGWAHALTLTVAVTLFALYWLRGDWPYLAVGVLALTIAVTEALLEWTGGSLGAGGAVLVAGLALLAASGGAVLLRRRREHGKPPPGRPGRFHLGRRERHA